MLSVRGRVARRRKTSWFLQRTSFTPWWAAEWSGGIIPCIIQECKLTLRRDIPSIKGPCHNRLPAEGTLEGGGLWMEGGMLLVAACCSWWSVSWSVIERESLLELATHYSNRWPDSYAWHVDRVRQRRCSLDRPNTIWAPSGNKTTSGPGFRDV